MKHRAHPIALCLLVLGSGLLPAASQAAVISRATEISMGREAAQEYERQAAVDTDPVLTARVRRIGNRLIAASQATQYPFEFHSVETNSVNAFSLPGGFIYFFRGLAQLTPGDDALAFIMAHEISHVTQRHGVRQMEKSLAVAGLLNFALRPSTTSGVLQLVIDMHYSRHDEAEADRLGLAMMARAGFDPSQGAEAMAMIARATKSGRSMPALLRSHPLPQTRIAALRRQAEALRAAPRPEPSTASLPPLPPSVETPLPPAPVTRSELFPLSVGMRWTYRVAGPAERQELTTTVLEKQPGHEGVYRVRTELDEGLAITRLLAVGVEGVWARKDGSQNATARSAKVSRQTTGGPVESSRPGSEGPGAVKPDGLASGTQVPQAAVLGLPTADPWHVEIPLPTGPQSEAQEGWETVRVPAGEFRAIKVKQHLPSGEAATVWLVPGTGMVRRAWERTGLVEELKSFHRPAPNEERDAGAGPAPTASPTEKRHE
jgi:Zn-dependent protease with chaperone function